MISHEIGQRKGVPARSKGEAVSPIHSAAEFSDGDSRPSTLATALVGQRCNDHDLTQDKGYEEKGRTLQHHIHVA